MLPMTSQQLAAQEALRDALNAWLDDPRKNIQVIQAISRGARMDLPAKAGSQSSVLSNCCRLVFDKRSWEDISSFCEGNPGWAQAAGADGAFPIHHAAACGNFEAIESLRAMGALASALDSEGLSPLHRLCLLEDPNPEAQYPEAIAALLRMWPQGANFSTSQGQPLHCAGKSGCWPAIAPLCAAGADADAAHEGWRPIDLACSRPKTGASARALAEAGANLELAPWPLPDASPQASPLKACLSKAWVDTSRALLAFGASLEAPSGRENGVEEDSLAVLGASSARGAAADMLLGLLDMRKIESQAAASFAAKPELADKIYRRCRR